jgi:hypothetical protein
MRFPIALAIAAALLPAADKGPPKGEASNKLLRIEATAYLEKDGIDKAVGVEMEKNVVVVEVKLIPAPGQKVNLELDDFLFRSDRDGQRTTPYTPTQIAGDSVLVVSEKWSGGGVAQQDNGPAWGGIGGRPSRLPGNGQGVGNGAGASEAVTSVRDDAAPAKKNENPLLAALKAKILAEKEISSEASGQLYFLLEGKHKPKQVELIYKTPAGPLSVRFAEPK